MLQTVGNIEASQGLTAQAMNMTQRVTQAIRHASAKAGVDFAYMLANATQESGLNPAAKASTSSATGLFQFVEQTWLRTVKAHGDKYGLGAVAERITIGSDGVARVNDAQAKKVILELRKDPQTAACMAAELTSENKETLECKTSGKVGATELYLAHFLGASGAAEFLNTMRANPGANAADVMPEAAAANSSVFYGKDGKPRTLEQVYGKFAQKFEGQGAAVKAVKTAAASPVRAAARRVLPSVQAEADLVGKSFAVSSLSRPTVSGAYKPGSAMSSPFAAMMLAQTDFSDLALPAMDISAAADDDEQKKRSAISVLGAAG